MNENDLLQEIKTLIRTASYSCYYTDKFNDFLDDLEIILNKFMYSKNTEFLNDFIERLNKTLDFTDLYVNRDDIVKLKKLLGD